MTIFLHKKKWCKQEWDIYINNLDLLCSRGGLKKNEFSKKIGVINAFRRDCNRPDIKTVALICEKFNIPQEWLESPNNTNYDIVRKEDGLNEDDTKSDWDRHGGGGIQFPPKERDIIEQVAYVLGSETDYSETLEQNIKIFYRAIKAEEANRRKGERRKQNTTYNGNDRRKEKRRQKIASGE